MVRKLLAQMRTGRERVSIVAGGRWETEIEPQRERKREGGRGKRRMTEI